MAYHEFASIYDQLMDHAPYDDWVQFTKDIIKQKDKAVSTMVDLGCGTGEVAIPLAKQGYDMIGVDISTHMLACASNKALDENVQVQWLAQDMRQLTGMRDIDMVLSYCDSINYITNETDLSSVFTRVYDSLADDGLFVFDFHALPYASTHLMDQTFTHVSDDLTYIWDCEAGPLIGEMTHYLTFFQADGALYRRFDEVHEQRTFSLDVYEALLKNAQFSKIRFYADFSLEKKITENKGERIFAIAEK
ncbi:MAG TPA: class I SAM-dependent methyltransferase [Pseudogracilibacillus sp.]|nr:class I SAM-dependent methyltransferase [Pseudogracilibacillus sp.]